MYEDLSILKRMGFIMIILDEKKVKLACAPIAWTNDDIPELGGYNTFEQTISEMALAGYSGSEVGGKYPKNIEILNKALKLRNITICNGWFSTEFTSKAPEKTYEAFKKWALFLKKAGAKVIGCSEQGNSIQGQQKSIFREKPIYTKEQWLQVSDGMNHLAKIANDLDMKCSFHHHMGTGVQTPQEVDQFMDMTNDDVYLLFDSGHLMYSERDAQAAYDILRKYIDRVAHVHLKDCRMNIIEEIYEKDFSFLDGVRMGSFTVPGDGDLDFEPIFKILQDSKYEGWMVVEAEQDPAIANPFEYALKARKYIKDHTGI